MADPSIVGDIYENIFNGVLNSQAIQWVIHWRVQSVSGATDVIQVSDGINTAVTGAGALFDQLLTPCPTNLAGTNVTTQRIYELIPLRPRSVRRSITYTSAGSTSTAATSNLAQVITRRTDSAGRTQVSNLHLPIGTTTTCLAAGQLATAQLTLLNSVKNGLFTFISILTGTVIVAPVIYHRARPGPPPVAAGYDLVTSAVAQSTVRTMRRRTYGIGI